MTKIAEQSRGSALHRAVRVALTVLLCLLVLGAIFVVGVGRWLVREDPIEKAQAIVVLSGGLPLRAVGAAELYRAGWAPEVWLTRSEVTARALAELGVAYTGEEIYDAQVLVLEGVPAGAIRVLPEAIVNTADELAAIAAALPADESGVVIVVTSKVHTRRVGTLWRRIGARRGRVIVRAAGGDPFSPGHWWRSSGEALDVVRECLGILNAWAGSPLRGS
jgi:uncharacterized SAM-binding protein YcdF (DUF218 family)